MSSSTVPRRVPGFPIRRLKVEVGKGPDAGAKVVADDVVTVGTASTNTLVLTDPAVSRFHLELRRRGDRIVLLDHGSTNGSVVRHGSVLMEHGAVTVESGAVLQLGDSELKVTDDEVVSIELRAPELLGEVRGRSTVMRRLMTTAAKVAEKTASVLLVGESGTGKELLARAIHEASPRAAKPFVIVDCGAIAPSLFASELFGHEKGAFTGADARHVGSFERASGGTLFLDEIGELPLVHQAALLGALERRTVRRVGGSEDLTVDVRVVSATNRDLRAAVNAGTFRLDLFYRLAVVTLDVPPLRDRRDDIPMLVEHLLREAGEAGPVEQWFPAATMEMLRAHPWPGNVRELRNLVTSTLAIGQVPQLSQRPQAAAGAAPVRGYRESRNEVLRDFEERYLKQLLASTGGNVRQAARDAQMDRSYLIELLKKHGLS